MKWLDINKAVTKFTAVLPIETAKEVADLLTAVANGVMLSMPTSRPMPSVASGVHELRVTDKAGIVRVFYYVSLPDRILVFHAFRKKTQATPKNEIETAQERLGRMIKGQRT